MTNLSLALTALSDELLDLIQEKIDQDECVFDLHKQERVITISLTQFNEIFKQEMIDLHDSLDKYDQNYFKDFVQLLPIEYRQDPDKLFIINF